MARTSRRKSPQRTAVVVLSMHRSGTSALTRVLSLLGCTLPQALIAGRENDNVTGFWESQAVVNVNEALCASAGSNWNDWVSLSPSWLSSPVRPGFVDQAHGVLESEFGDSRFFVLKDPRLCRLMPVWIEALERFDACPVYVLPVRNPFEVAASLRKRNQLIEGDSHLAWLRHMLDAERYSRNQPRVFVRYDDLLGNWRKLIERISEKLDLSWPGRSIAAEEKIDAFLTPGLRHHSFEDARVFEDTHLPPWIRQCYDVMSRWARDESRNDDRETLDRINAEMNAAKPAFESIVAEARSLGKMRRELDKRLKIADAAVLKQREALEATQAERDRSEADLGAVRTKLDEAAGGLEKLRMELVERDERLEVADATVREQRETLEATQVGLSEATNDLEELRVELIGRDERLRSLERLRTSEREEARLAIYRISQEASNRLAKQESALSAAWQETKTLRDRISEIEPEVTRTRESLAALSRQLEHSQLRSAEITTIARSLLADYMRRVHREIHRPSPRTLSRVYPLKRLRLKKSAEELRKFAEELRGSVYFDPEWYLARYGDVAKAGIDPALHFIEHGFLEGRAPSARFEETR